MQHAHARTRLPLHKGNHIQLSERTRDNMLPRPQLLHRTQPVAQHSSTFELQFLSSLVHLFGQFFFQFFCVSLKQIDRLCD